VYLQSHCIDAVILHDVTETVKTSGRRASRTAETEERILRAAGELFARQGYAATTLTAVADAADVAHRTVYVRFGTKAQLLKRLVDVAIVGDTRPIAVAERDWFAHALDAPTLVDRIDALADGSAQLLARAGDLLAVALEAQHAEPLLADAFRDGRAATRANVLRFVDAAAHDGLLDRERVDLRWLVDTITVVSHAETYLLLRASAGWDAARYREWFATTLRALLVPRS
jgi:AcrR family transcriptional regulator